MTREIALHCMKSYSESHSDLCELCPIYGQTGSDHCFEDALEYVIKALEQEPFINKPCVSSGVCEHDKQKVLDKIRAEITDCLKALDEIEESRLNIYLPNEISGRRLTYKQCLEFIDKYKAESER